MTDPVLALGLGAFALLLLALPLAFWSFSGSGRGSQVVRWLFADANLPLTTLLLRRLWQSGHFPIRNPHQSPILPLLHTFNSTTAVSPPRIRRMRCVY